MRAPFPPPDASPAPPPVAVPPDTVVAIDGPAGSGKSSTARAVARRLGLLYIDTGAMYRALTWAAGEAGIAPDDAGSLAALLRDARIDLRPGSEQEDARVFWNGHDVSTAIRTPAVEGTVSAVSAHGAVRCQMVERQRALGRGGGVVMEGRDIGSAVFPLATVKLYLDATPQARAERRLRQHRQRGLELDAAAVAADLAARDRSDSGRTESPLTIPADAIVLDTSAWSLEEQIAQALAAVRAGVAERAPRPLPADAPVHRLPWRYRLAYAVFGAAARWFRLRVVGREHLDLPGGVIIAANHLSWWDPPLLGSTIRRYPVHSLAKAELFRFLPTALLFRWLDAIPIRRRGYDSGAFEAATKYLAAGHDLMIFPEGTRRPSGRPGPVRSGLGSLAQRSGAPIVPVFLRGTPGVQPGGSADAPLEIRFAPAVRLHALPALRARLDEREISARIAALFQAIYEELQARSWADRPRTAWEIKEEERAERSCAVRTARLFGHRRSRDTHAGPTPPPQL